MEEVFWLQSGKSFTVETIQNILLQRTTVNYSPDGQHTLLQSKGDGEAISFSEINNYALGIGAEVPAEITRIMLLLLADFISKHPVASTPAIIARILEFNQFDVFPQVFTQGLFASPTAHMLLPVFGKGKVYYQGYLLNAADVHDIFSWQLLTWPENFSAPMRQTSFLSLAVLVYSFIQFKKLARYASILFARNNHFQTQTEILESQIQNALTFPEDHPGHVIDLALQLKKLLTKFGEHIFEYFSDQNLKMPEFLVLNENLKISISLLLDLLEQLSQENLILFENSSNTTLSSNGGIITSMQPYQILINLEQILAIATLIQVNQPLLDPEFKKNQIYEGASSYLNQVISVLKEANFAELIRKTVTFMYATSQTNKPIV